MRRAILLWESEMEGKISEVGLGLDVKSYIRIIAASSILSEPCEGSHKSYHDGIFGMRLSHFWTSFRSLEVLISCSDNETLVLLSYGRGCFSGWNSILRTGPGKSAIIRVLPLKPDGTRLIYESGKEVVWRYSLSIGEKRKTNAGS